MSNVYYYLNNANDVSDGEPEPESDSDAEAIDYMV
jgi:hypothetical protein